MNHSDWMHKETIFLVLVKFIGYDTSLCLPLWLVLHGRGVSDISVCSMQKMKYTLNYDTPWYIVLCM